MHFFSKSNAQKVIVTLSDMKLIDIPPHGTPIFIKAKQGHYECQTQSVQIVENKAIWPKELSIKCKVNKNLTERRIQPLRLSFRLETASGNSFTRYGIAEIDVSTAYHENVNNAQILLSNCTYNSKFLCHIDIQNPGQAKPASALVFPQDILPRDQSSDQSLDTSFQDISETTKSMTTQKIGSLGSNALVSNPVTGGTTVAFQNVTKLPHELAPIPVSLEHYNELEAQVDSVIQNIMSSL